MKHKLLLLYSWFVRTVLIWLPDVPFIMRFRGWLYGLGMKRCGKNFQVAQNVIINGLEGLSVGNDIFINNNCIILSTFGISFGSEVIVGPGCVFSANNHLPKGNSFRFGARETAPISIGKGSWIAANCTILLGSNIPDYSLVAAGSVFLKKTSTSTNDTGCVWGGIPAKKITTIKDKHL